MISLQFIIYKCFQLNAHYRLTSDIIKKKKFEKFYLYKFMRIYSKL